MRYVTDDNKVFDNLEEAEKHEKEYKDNKKIRAKRKEEVLKAQQEYLRLKKAYEDDYKKTSDETVTEDDLYNFVKRFL